ncbi:MAG: hypothetical protein ACYDH6_05165 [Acidimicrobiales bacterium]
MTNEEIAARWADGLARDFSALDVLYSPTMLVWHSTDDTWIGREESSRRAAELERVGRPVFRDVRAQATERGFVLQAAIENPDDRRKVTHVVQLVTVKDGLATHVEEYIAPGRAANRPGV